MTSVVSFILDVRITLALSFALAVAAAISSVLLKLSTKGSVGISVEPAKARVFKLESKLVKLRTKVARRRWTSLRVAGASISSGVGVTLKPAIGDPAEIEVVPAYAGSFSGLKVRFEFVDPLGVFRELRDVQLDFVLDALPLALLASPQRIAVPVTSTGEKPAGVRGAGQEMYAVDDYQPFTETRNILWKRVGRSPEEKLLVKVREANITSRVKVGVVEVVERGQLRNVWMDQVTEALAAIGVSLVRAGVEMEVLRSSSDGVRVLSASSMEELAELVMEMWRRGTDTTRAGEVISKSDMVVIGSTELSQDLVLEAVGRKFLLLIPEGSLPERLGERMVVYSGGGSALKLVKEILAS